MFTVKPYVTSIFNTYSYSVYLANMIHWQTEPIILYSIKIYFPELTVP